MLVHLKSTNAERNADFPLEHVNNKTENHQQKDSYDGSHQSSLRKKNHAYKQEFKQKANEEVSVHGHPMERGDIFKFVGLIVFFALMALVCFLLWPYMQELFEPGGIDRVIAEVRGAGPVGALILLGLQFLQIVVAFIPGEVVQLAAGMLYGPWLGGAIILLGCVISSAFIFVLVHKLGAPFVQNMVPTNQLEKFRKFEASGKLNIIVFVLFLIPGLPKDVFTYLVPLTDMRMKTFVVLSNVARIPGIIVSTYAADGLVGGRIIESIVIFSVAAVIALLGIIFRDKIMSFLDQHIKRKNH